ncbi:MAG: DUF4399 domain-containing protein [Porticoccaceae bacterium]
MLKTRLSIPLLLALTLPAFAFPASATASDTPATAETPAARAYIISPRDGDVVTSPVRVQFGLEGAGVAPAGVEKTNTGHHHLLINVAELPDLDRPIPADDNHRHFGGGQTEVMLELAPGEHSLQLLLGDHLHVPLKPVVASEKITIRVK